jgi:transcription antitermination factor NusA-like protein
VRKGEITDVDISVAKTILELEKTHPSLQRITLRKAYQSGETLILIVNRGDIQFLAGSDGRILREISQSIGKKVKVLEAGGSDRKFIEDLFSPLNIVTINTIWLPDGSIESRLVLSGSPRYVPVDVEALRKLAKQIRGINLRVEFEKTLDRKMSWT